ncbi:MAG: hypothetical protein MK165_12610 [Pirellulaceae bacterium]|nr:hypothetical protein [Pirellulaceae bacterium]
MGCQTLRITLSLLTVVCLIGSQADAQRLVPGTGTKIDYVGDDFENPEWKFVHRLPKSSRENDGRARGPLGSSVNRRWAEGPERGHPDHMKVIPTPEGGVVGSEYALLLMSQKTGIPGQSSFDVQQDDLIANISSRLGTSIRVSELPSCVVRLYLPSPDQWENRSGPHFGFRTGVSSTPTQRFNTGFFRGGPTSEPYWPGIWIHFRSETNPRYENDSAFIKVRGNKSGRDFKVAEITQFGWWTLGMGYTGDGMVHYYASPGVDDLTPADHLTSQYPYSLKARSFRSFFFNVVNHNDGRTWSTPFVIDDAEFFVGHPERVQSIAQRKQKNDDQRARTASKNNNPETKKR